MAGKTKRGAMHPARQRRIWEREGGICWMCGQPVPMSGGDLVRYDHRITLEIGQSDDDAAIFPIHKACDDLKTPQDQRDIAKVRRMRNKHEGVSTRQKKAIPARAFQKGQKTRWPKRGFTPPR